MAHVIDILVVELGLDPSKLSQQQRQTVDNFKKFTNDLEAGGRRAEESFDRVGDTIAGVRTGVLELFGAMAAGKGFVEFAAGAVRSASEIGRLERNIGVSTLTISKWQGVARIFGGDAQSMASSFKSISDAFAGMKVGVASPMIAELRAISAAGGKTIDITKGVEQAYLDLADNLKAIHDKDPALAGLMQSRLGLDPALFDAMLQGGDKLKQLLKEINGFTSEQAAAATELDRRWSAFVTKIDSWSKSKVLNVALDAQTSWDQLSKGQIISSDSWLGKHLAGSSNAWMVAPPDSDAVTRMDQSNPLAVAPMPSVSGGRRSRAELVAYIRQGAIKRGMDPDVAVQVASKEGLDSFQSTVITRDGSREKSYGAFQLYMGGGLGNDFKSRTGKDPSNPAYELDGIDFALDNAKQNGWKAFHGAANNHIPNWAGINAPGGAAPAAGADNSVVIENLNVYPPSGADVKGIANDAQAQARKQASKTSQANYGPQG